MWLTNQMYFVTQITLADKLSSIMAKYHKGLAQNSTIQRG